MIATHTASVYGGTIKLCAVKSDPLNRNMVYGLVVRDSRGTLHTGRRVWVAASQVTEHDPMCDYCEIPASEHEEITALCVEVSAL